jgi:hypothetical protein
MTPHIANAGNTADTLRGSLAIPMMMLVENM